jgi:hypothetical protein
VQQRLSALAEVKELVLKSIEEAAADGSSAQLMVPQRS